MTKYTVHYKTPSASAKAGYRWKYSGKKTLEEAVKRYQMNKGRAIQGIRITDENGNIILQEET